MTPFILPAGYGRIRQMDSFQELLSTPFRDGINAMYWPRKLEGDFGEVIRHLSLGETHLPQGGPVARPDPQPRRTGGYPYSR